ncbi:MAG: hypothetical protein ACREOZ_04225, partial [Gloeomargaritales cyanobacterium]
MLLGHAQSKGASSEGKLRTVGGTTYDTCKAACEALGLLQSDSEWEHSLNDASLHLHTSAFRDFFLTIVINNLPVDVPMLLYNFHINLVDDYCMRFRRAGVDVFIDGDVLSLAISVIRD